MVTCLEPYFILVGLKSHRDVLRTDVFSTGVAELRVQRLVAGAAVRSALPHDVPLPPQSSLTLETTEVFHVPVSPLGLRTLVC